MPFAAQSLTKPRSRQRSLRLSRLGTERRGRRLEEAAGGVGLGRRRRRPGAGHLPARADGAEGEKGTAGIESGLPSPTGFWKRVVTRAPTIEPTPKPAKTTPAQNDEMCSDRAM